MPTHTVGLLGREEIAKGTYAFRFEKPDGFEFKPGQYVSMRLIDPPETDNEGTSRSFSIASAPHEASLMFATRIRATAMKRVLNSLRPGAEVKITGPFGSFTLDPDSSRPAALLAGGIGITPFRSIAVHAAHESLPHRLLLFYSNRTPEDAAFLEELQTLETQNRNYKLITTMTEIERLPQSWKGERGRIDRRMLGRHLEGLPAPIYYVVGPPGLVRGLRKMLESAGIDSASMRTEEFVGY